MNKSHRIVWSDARNAYIVAGENASAKGKPSSVRKALATAIAALFMGPGLAAAQSCEGQNPLTDAQTSTQCYENVDVTVAAGGSVVATGTTAIGVEVQAAPYARNFANQGTLEADAEATTPMLMACCSRAGFPVVSSTRRPARSPSLPPAREMATATATVY